MTMQTQLLSKGTICIGLALVAGRSSSQVDPFESKTVAITGETATGNVTGSPTYTDFPGAPFIDNTSRVRFRATLSTNYSCIVGTLGSNNSPKVIAAANQAAFDGTTEIGVYNTFHEFVGANNSFAYTADYTSSSGTYTGLWYARPKTDGSGFTTTLVARDGAIVGSTTLSFKDLNLNVAIEINDDGDLAFVTQMNAMGNPFYLFRYDASTNTLTHSEKPSYEAADTEALGNAGHVAIRTQEDGMWGLILVSPSSSVEVMRETDAAPGLTATTFTTVNGNENYWGTGGVSDEGDTISLFHTLAASFVEPVICDGGGTYELERTESFWFSTPSTLEFVDHAFNEVPDRADIWFVNLHDKKPRPRISNSGKTVFLGHLTTVERDVDCAVSEYMDNFTDRGLFRFDPDATSDNLKTICIEGDSFDGFSGSLNMLFPDGFHVNSNGDVAFRAAYGSSAVDQSIWLYDVSEDEFVLILREGGTINVNYQPPGGTDDLRGIGDGIDFQVLPNFVQNGTDHSGFNNDGVIVFKAELDDIDEDELDENGIGIFTTPLPADCPADTNCDGQLTPADFGAWIAAFNAMSSKCDQNGDGLCTAADFGAWISNYNAGCLPPP